MQKLRNLWTSWILHGYYLRPSPSSTPSFVEFHQGLWIWWANKWLSESHDVSAKSMNFRTAAPKAQYKHRFQWNLVCSKGGYPTFSIPNFSWFLKATPKQSWNVFERVEPSKIGHISNTKLQLMVDLMSKFRRARICFLLTDHVINVIECFCSLVTICSCTPGKLATWGESQLRLQTYATAFSLNFP